MTEPNVISGMTDERLERLRAGDYNSHPDTTARIIRDLIAHLDALRGVADKVTADYDWLKREYSEMCERLHEATRRHHLGLGGERIDQLVVDAVDALTRERDEARRMLGTGTVRLGILRDRMEACEEAHPDTHRVSLLEVPAWIEEQQAVTSGPTPAPPERAPAVTEGHVTDEMVNAAMQVDFDTWQAPKNLSDEALSRGRSFYRAVVEAALSVAPNAPTSAMVERAAWEIAKECDVLDWDHMSEPVRQHYCTIARRALTRAGALGHNQETTP